jgi:hypothetical protein
MTKPIQIRSSSWAELFDCAARWAAKNLDGIVMPSSVAAHIGTAIHAGTAAFDESGMAGDRISPMDAADLAVDELRADENVRWTTSEPSRREAEAIVISQTLAYCKTFDHYQWAAVEHQCQPLDIDMGADLTIRLTGTLDRIRKHPDSRLGVADLKTGVRRINSDGLVDTAADGAQLGCYELLYEADTGLVIDAPAEILAIDSKCAGVVASAAVPRTREILIGSDEEPGLIFMAAMYLRAGIFPPNPKSGLCSDRYCPIYDRCKYHN